jgi:SPP1 gp7 family putative phage head morphogenesis protein
MPTPAPTANVALRDAMVRHQIYLQRLAGGIAKKVHAILNATEEDLAQTIRDRLADATGLESAADVARMKQVLALLENMRNDAWQNLDETLTDQLMAFAQAEPNFLAQQLDVTSPVVLDLVLPSVSALKAIVTKEPFEGRVLKDWAKSLADNDVVRMKREIQMGMTAGEDAATIARRIVGTAKLSGTDGITQITRNNAEAVVRTAINFISNQIKQDFLDLNKEYFSEELYLATLDSRTTPICRSLDGNVYDVGVGPIPPLHFNCRSTRVPVFNGKAIGTRPVRNYTEQSLLREFAKQNGILPVPSSRADLPRGTKGAYDKFAQKRIRELTGTVPAATTYNEWLSSQDAAIQDDILGKTKGALFRKGGLTLDKFVNRQGDELTLHELAQKQKDAFRAAGLNPEDY